MRKYLFRVMMMTAIATTPFAIISCGGDDDDDNTPNTITNNSGNSASGSGDTQTDEESSSHTGYINGHEYVDLGLSVKWAACNIGASSPSDYGNYYAWGETTTKSLYAYYNCVTYGKTLGNIGGNASYDAARANWGSTWRMPTVSEIDELVNKCSHTWTTINGHNGYKVTGSNGSSIFLPAAGWYIESTLTGTGYFGSYMSSEPYESVTQCAYRLYFDADKLSRDWGNCAYGDPVRPVSK